MNNERHCSENEKTNPEYDKMFAKHISEKSFVSEYKKNSKVKNKLLEQRLKATAQRHDTVTAISPLSHLLPPSP